MPSLLRLATCLCLPFVAGACLAQAEPPAAPLSPPPSHLLAPAPAASAASAAGPAGSTKTVIEDDAVRIEETRLRGQTQRVTVRNKLPGVKDYEIIVPAGGKDPSQERGAAGKRAWSFFNF
jgi:hypothetical protein